MFNFNMLKKEADRAKDEMIKLRKIWSEKHRELINIDQQGPLAEEVIEMLDRYIDFKAEKYLGSIKVNFNKFHELRHLRKKGQSIDRLKVEMIFIADEENKNDIQPFLFYMFRDHFKQVVRDTINNGGWLTSESGLTIDQRVEEKDKINEYISDLSVKINQIQSAAKEAGILIN